MAIWPILKMGHPVLQKIAEPVTNFGSAQLLELVDDMFETMIAANGAGLAAPQIGISQRIVVFGMVKNPRYPTAPPIANTVLINPVIERIGSDESEDWEGCLSVPGMRGWVPRVKRIRYRGLDAHGKPIEREAEDFHARVVQHECDHLDGLLYPQRIRDMTKFGFIQELFPPSGIVVET